MKIFHCIRFSLMLVLLFAGISFADNGEIIIIPVSDAIGPGIAEFVSSGITRADDQNAACVVIELDTPGGLAEAMREIVMSIYAAKTPVVVFVSPGGARAASAGVMITMAADIAAMAPGTNIGAAHPVGTGGKEIGGVMSEKVTNDMVAYVKSIAEKRGRNAEWAEKAVRESVSVTENEALEKNIIDIVAADMDDLVRQIDGFSIEGKGDLRLSGAMRTRLKESIRTKILKTISDPNIAYILMMIGLAGLYFELSHPGAIFPGVVGGIALILAFFSFQTLPVNTAGILLILLSIIFFIMEIKVISYGLLSIAGVVSLLLGSLMLFKGNGPQSQLSWHVLIPILLIVSAFFVTLASLAFKAQMSSPRTGGGGLVRETGIVKKRIDPEGKVQIHGELWYARAKEPIEEGAQVCVVAVDNLVLDVERKT
ncbi:MAG: nodulation protein NfeD [Deltaproteobacteria bacterium]|nr:MAG: nodulation protein NfeD [Deltaproteobacteria bacterium]RLC18136.1 MAG: nodulation protein NfeD [Deltaproteobacteria bacterium]